MYHFLRRVTKFINITVLIIACMLLPIFVPGLLWGLAGDTTYYVMLIGFGYVGVLVFGIAAVKRPKYFIGTLLSVLLMILSSRLDFLYWERHYADVCEKIQTNPNCTELDYGWECVDAPSSVSIYPKSMCEQNKTNFQELFAMRGVFSMRWRHDKGNIMALSWLGCKAHNKAFKRDSQRVACYRIGGRLEVVALLTT